MEQLLNNLITSMAPQIAFVSLQFFISFSLVFFTIYFAIKCLVRFIKSYLARRAFNSGHILFAKDYNVLISTSNGWVYDDKNYLYANKELKMYIDWKSNFRVFKWELREN